MNRFVVTLALALLALPSVLNAQPKPDIDPAVWVVKDKDTTIYFFGTFHLLDGKSEWFNDEVKTAFDAAQEVDLEVVMPDNPADLQPLIMKYALDTSGKKLSDRLSPEAKKTLDAQIAAAGLPPGALEMFKPWFAAVTLTSLQAQKLGLNGDNGPEAVLTKAARAAGKPVRQLESVEQQLAMLDALPEAEQVKFLEETLKESEALDQELPKLIKAWSDGDSVKLAALLNEGLGDDPLLYKALLSDRNARWADWTVARLAKPGTVLVAVGAGHLAGKDSVLDTLAKRGIKSERFKGRNGSVQASR
ncbi:MAG TPA: TraB/GumN family protein [Allosphingosinicella sp.]|nr:TraB/GumN family protein [Allosphingosinicella sp.]